MGRLLKSLRYKTRECDLCQETGTIEVINEENEEVEEVCPDCEGTGEIYLTEDYDNQF